MTRLSGGVYIKHTPAPNPCTRPTLYSAKDLSNFVRMHRAFRSPIIPALQNATRTRLYGSTTTQTQSNQTTNNDTKSALAKAGLKHTPNALDKKAVAENIDVKMRNEFMRIKNSIQDTQNVRELSDLVKVHEIMQIYRKYRETQNVNASEPIHAILTTIRLRGKVLKPVISKVRRQIMGTQNVILAQYLNEIAEDLLSGRSYASHFALCYMLTAFNTMEDQGQASAVWKRLNEGAKADLSEKLNDPRVVTAVLRFSDPSVLSLEEVEKLYHKTTEKYGQHILSDDALAMGYMRFGEFERAVKVYAMMCSQYDIGKWRGSIVRLHNQILTLCPDPEISKVFFDTAVSDESFVQLHPSAAAKYVQHYYDAKTDVQGAVEIFCRAIKRLSTQSGPSSDPKNCVNILAETLKCVVQQHFAITGPVEEAQQLLEKIINATNGEQIYLNAILSFASKAWPNSQYIADFQRKYFSNTNELQFDTLRVLLNSSQFLTTEQCPTEKVSAWWHRLISLKPPQVFDWLSLAKACDNPERVKFYTEQLAALKPTNLTINYSSTPVVKAALLFSGQLTPDGNHVYEGTYSNDTVESELKVRDVAVGH